MSDLLPMDIMSLPKDKQYHFNVTAVEQVVTAHGGKPALAQQLGCSVKQLHRTLRNVSASRRLQRDILEALQVFPLTVGAIRDT